MDSHSFNNAYFSIICGVIGSIGTYFHDYGFVLHDLLDLVHIISIGILGGVGGYIGRVISQKIHLKFKK
jgi:hypothetical protein